AARARALDLEAEAGPVYVRSKELDLELDSHLRLATAKGAPGGPLGLSGNVHIRRGRLDISGRRFDFERGDLAFDGSPKPNPTLHTRPTRQFPQAVVVIQIQGTLEKPELRLMSEPPIYADAQVVSLILTGDPGGGPNTGKPVDVTGAVAGVVLGRL